MSLSEVATDAETVEPQSFETRSLDWRINHVTTRTALFRLYPGVAVLQHVRTTTVDRGPTPAGCEIDTDAWPADLPGGIVGELRSEGYDVVGGHR